MARLGLGFPVAAQLNSNQKQPCNKSVLTIDGINPKPYDEKFSKKYPCLHNNTALINQISLFDKALVITKTWSFNLKWKEINFWPIRSHNRDIDNFA